jgi:hypothetical protein
MNTAMALNFMPLCKGSCDQGRRNDGEHELIDHESLRGDGGSIGWIRRGSHASQKEVMQAADDAVAFAKGQRVAKNGPRDGHNRHHGKALHHGGQDVFLADKPAIEKRQSGAGHEKDQGGTGEHPGVIGGAFGIRNLLFQFCQPVGARAVGGRCSWAGSLRR